MRTDIADRFYRVFAYQDVDRVPDLEFGYWPQTIRRWLKEGLPAEMATEKNAMFSSKLDGFFGFDVCAHEGIHLSLGMNPCFTEEVLERKADGSVIQRDGSGVVAHRYTNECDDSSIPHYLRFPVENPADWESMKARFRFDDPQRTLPADQPARLRKAVQDGKAITFFICGIYGQLRNWMGMENLSTAFYDYPEMIHDMADHWAELVARQLETLPADIPIDLAFWWEDMASKNGPLCSPTTFREFLQPAYRRVMQVARKHGCELSMVDCDGNPHDIVRNWLEEGVNIMFPLEVAAGVDPYAWRREFGRELRMRGGIAKEPLVRGGSAIDRELERIRPLLEMGGVIPHLDHLVPPDIPYKHYCEYLEKKRKLIGKA